MKNHYKKYFFINISLSLLLLMGFQNIQAQSKDQAGGITPGTDCTEKGTAGETCASVDQSLRCVRSPSPNALPMNSCSPYPCQFVQPITGTQTVYITKLPQSINLNVDSCAPSTADAYVPFSMPATTAEYKGDIRFEFNPSAYGFGLQSDIKMIPANYSFIYTKYIVHDAPNCTYSGYSAPGVSTAFTVLYGKTIDTYTSQSADATHTCASYKVTPTCLYGAGFNTAPGNYLYCYDGCTGPDGTFIPNGGSKVYYKTNQSATCPSQVETRVCTNGVLSGSATYTSCNTTINGLCGSASGTSVAAAPSTSTDLCSAGTPSAVTGTGPWKWSCAGAYGGSTQSCSANQNGCGFQSYSTFYSKNNFKDLKINSKSEMFAWLLSGAPKQVNACVTCDAADPMPSCASTADIGNILEPCIASCVAPTTNWKVCNCAAVAKCGSAALTPSASMPSSNLCASGLATKVTDGGSSWTWDCKGTVNGNGSDVSCSTNKSGGSLCSWSMSSVLVKNDSYGNKYDLFASLFSGGGLHNANACTVDPSCDLGPGDFEVCTTSNIGAKHSCSETQCPMRNITWTCKCDAQCGSANGVAYMPNSTKAFWPLTSQSPDSSTLCASGSTAVNVVTTNSAGDPGVQQTTWSCQTADLSSTVNCSTAPTYTWGACFVAGTKITMDDGLLKNIEDVKVGEKILTYDELTQKNLVRPVTEALVHKKKLTPLYTFYFEDKKLTSNDIHLIFLPREQKYVSAAEIYKRWYKGENIFLHDENKNEVFVKYISYSEDEVPLYNLHVKGMYDNDYLNKDDQLKLTNHNYFANGVLVHNLKQGGCGATCSADCNAGYACEPAAASCVDNGNIIKCFFDSLSDYNTFSTCVSGMPKCP